MTLRPSRTCSSGTGPGVPGGRDRHAGDVAAAVSGGRGVRTYVTAEVPELHELISAAGRALGAATVGSCWDHDPQRRAREQRNRRLEWTALAVMGAFGAPLPPFPQPEPTPARLDRAAMMAVRRLQEAVAAAPDPGHPQRTAQSWRAPDGTRLVAFRALVLAPADLQALEQAARAVQAAEALRHDPCELAAADGTDHGPAALRCLLAVLIPVDDLDTAILADWARTGAHGPDLDQGHRPVHAAAGSGDQSRVLDGRAQEAHQRVAGRILDALHNTA